MALVFGTGPGNDVIIAEEKIVAHRKFANKIWNASRFVLSQTENTELEQKILIPLSAEDKEILKTLNQTVKSVTDNIEKFYFHQSAETLYHFFWHTFCDKYIEQSKKQMREGTEEEQENTKQILLYVLLTSLKLLHPFMPFITEQIYQLLPGHQKDALIIEDWPIIHK